MTDSPKGVAERSYGRAVGRASVLVVGGMLIGRVAGLTREILVAHQFGATPIADVAVVLLAAPDLLVSLVGTGAVGLALIPVLTGLDHASQSQILRRLTLSFLAGGAVISLIVWVLAVGAGTGWATAAGVSASQFRWAAAVTGIAIPAGLAVAVTTAFLQTRNRFLVTSGATLLFNIPVLIALMFRPSLLGLAAGLAIGSVLRYGSQAVTIGRAWLSRAPSPAGRHELRWSTYAATIGASTAVVVQTFVPVLVTVTVGQPGDVALTNYGWKLVLIPISVLATLMSVAAYPSLVRLVKLGEPAEVRQQLSRLIAPSVAASMAIAVWLFINAASTAAFVYSSSDMREGELAEIAEMLRWGALSITPMTLASAALAILHGTNRSGVALMSNTGPLVLFVAASFALYADYGPEGILLSFFVASVVLCLTSVALVWKKTGYSPLRTGDIPPLLRATVLAVLAALACDRLTSPSVPASTLVNGTVYVGLCLTAYVTLGSYLKAPLTRTAEPQCREEETLPCAE